MNMNDNKDNDNDRMNEKELIYLAVFEQIKECRDIISSLLIIYEFIKSENISTTFNVSELRQFALSAAHNKTSTHLWHINALIATSQNFNDLLIGIEMCFDGWLGNKQSFIKHKNKQKSSSKLLSKSPSKSKSKLKQAPKAEITSFVTSYYQPSIDIDIDQEQDENKSDIDDETNKLQDIVRINDENENINLKNEGMVNENENIMIDDENSKEFEKEEFMKSYRGKISSPISFRMRQQKRMKQRERRQNSSRNKNINNNRFLNINNHENNNETFQKKLDFQHFDDNMNNNNNKNEANILSPFNISKFAKRVDLVPNDMDSPQFHRKNI